ncbi:hypothetical protein BDV39DRAFT_188979 [Aspergillus sergii]|uniref:Carrier domain-containing protein n=1 Tax=Aspergillus sergii TaxID=1034303 RepID=A0A5N6XJK0_9EURO|nr:hypothetical protein BDV39DRAFT_188979 [Aspergillus sergii]
MESRPVFILFIEYLTGLDLASESRLWAEYLGDVSNRTGLTITTMPFRVKLCPQKCVLDALSDIQHLFADWVAHEHYGLPNLKNPSPEYSAACEFHNLLRNGYPLVVECFLDTASVTFKANFDPGALHGDQEICTIGPEDTACLKNWNQIWSETGEDRIHDLIEIHATAQPDELAISIWDGDLTYEQLSSLSSKVVELLKLVRPLYRLEDAEHDAPLGTASSRRQTEALIASVKPCNAAYMVLTSSSTGTLKGPVIEHRSFATNALTRSRSRVLPAKARVLQLASRAFDASIAEILFTLVTGGCVCVPREVDRYTNIVEYVRYFTVNVLYLTPSVARSLQPDQLPHLGTLILVGHVDLTSFQQPVTISTDHRSIGIAPCASCWVVEPENHNTLLPVGAVGELLVEGPIPHGIYKTGDLDTQVQLRGQRIELGEVEHCIHRCTGNTFKTAIVELVTADDKPSAMVAFLLTTQDGTTGVPNSGDILRSSTPQFQSLVQDIGHSLENQLPSYMIPERFLPLSYVPKCLTGKTDRKYLRETAGSLPPTSTDEVTRIIVPRAPVSEPERILQEVVGDVLQLDIKAVGLDSNFFHLGGNSLTAIKLISRLKRRGWHNLRGTDIHQHPVLSHLALKLGESLSSSRYSESV